MEIEAIKALPVAELADKDCALFLWITLPKLCEAWGVMDAWGFEYRTTAFVWIKLNPKAGTVFWGPGSWTHANAELCLLATKGHPKRQARNIHQLIISNREEHSKNRRRPGGASRPSWVTSPVWSCLPAAPPQAGMYGATR